MVYHAEFAWLLLVERCYYWLLPLDLEVINVVETADFMLVIVKSDSDYFILYTWVCVVPFPRRTSGDIGGKPKKYRCI